MGKVLVFVGPKGAGKDEALRQLQGKVKGRLSFATPMKKILSEVFELPIQYMHDPLLKEKELKEPIVLTAKSLKAIKRKMTSLVTPVDLKAGLKIYDAERFSIYGFEHKRMKTTRQLMQFIGTEFIRGIYSNWHIEATLSDPNLDERLKQGHLVCTDCRFENEAQAIKDRFGDEALFYYINRPEAEERLANATHQSELEILKLKEFISKDNILDNSGSIEDYNKVLKALVNSLSARKKDGRKQKTT